MSVCHQALVMRGDRRSSSLCRLKDFLLTGAQCWTPVYQSASSSARRTDATRSAMVWIYGLKEGVYLDFSSFADTRRCQSGKITPPTHSGLVYLVLLRPPRVSALPLAQRLKNSVKAIKDVFASHGKRQNSSCSAKLFLHSQQHKSM